MNKKRLYWSLQIGGWSTYVAIQLFIRALSAGVDQLQLAFWLSEGILFLLMTHYIRFLIKTLKWMDLQMSLLIPRVFAIVVVMGMVVFILRAVISVPLGLYNPESVSLANFLGLTAIYSLIFFIWMVLYFTYHYFLQYNTSLKHEAAMKEIELNNLKSQLNPHFIFNSLNSIRALVDENPANSKKAITQLSNILRNSLITDKQRLTSLNDELNVVNDYLGLERIRYEERLKVHMDIDPASLNYLIPPLMLQTLVENGIKHGIARLKKGGSLSLLTRVDERQLTIEIRNTGKLIMKNGTKNTGMGIQNTKQRLNLIYGESATFSIFEEEGDVLTRLQIPKREEL